MFFSEELAPFFFNNFRQILEFEFEIFYEASDV